MTFVKACQRLLSLEPPSSLQLKIVHSILIIVFLEELRCTGFDIMFILSKLMQLQHSET